MVAVAKKRDEFQAFYTNCNHITAYMIAMLDCKDGMTILEPCAGNGAFIDEIIRQQCNVYITAIDINHESISNLKKKYSNRTNISIQHADFSLLNSAVSYDRIIANPPYGAYQTSEKKMQLKVAYPGIYAKETYGVFLIRAIELLKPNGRLVFIIPDTFLNLHMHQGLRKKLLNYKIDSIALFPSKFFPGINFGYAGLSIISIKKEAPENNWRFPIYKGFNSSEDFSCLLTQQKNKFEIAQLNYNRLQKNPSKSFFFSTELWISNLFEQNLPTIEYFCNVVTGFYSGNDALNLRRTELVTYGLKKYQEIDSQMICSGDQEMNPSPLNGIRDDKCWIPIVKGGNKRFYKPSEWFMDWNEKTVANYKIDKKARFQNSNFYFKQGIAIPMVSSTSITGSLLNRRLFDQSIVGVFPRQGQEHLLMFFLGFFNSKVCNSIIRTINSSTNNTSK